MNLFFASFRNCDLTAIRNAFTASFSFVILSILLAWIFNTLNLFIFFYLPVGNNRTLFLVVGSRLIALSSAL
jgi:hypothetical protein